MKKLVIALIVNFLSLLIIDYLFSGIKIEQINTVFALAVVIGLLNAFIKPILKFIAFPITILTLGIFSLVINAFVFNLGFSLIENASINNFTTAFLAAIVFSIINSIISKLLDDQD